MSYVYRNRGTHQVVYVPTAVFAGDVDWELISDQVTKLEPSIPRPTRSPAGMGRILFFEDFSAPVPALFNDGLGTISRDWEIPFNGGPTLRLDPMGQSVSPTTLSVPSQPTGTAVGSGGTLSSGTYYYKITAMDFAGHQTSASTERSVATAASDSVTLTWTAVDGAASYRIYRGTVSGTNYLLAETTGLTYLDTGTATDGATAPPGSNGTGTPGRTAATGGVVAKRRIHDGFRSRLGLEMWFRLTSGNLTSNTYLSMSIYNRDGTNSHHSRVWLDPNGNNQPLKAHILDGAASATAGKAVYRTVSTSVLQNGGGTHTYDLLSGRMDRVGGWHWVKMVVDMATGKYVSLRLDGENEVDLSGYDLDVQASAGFAGQHFSVELSASTTTRPRYVNIANFVATAE